MNKITNLINRIANINNYSQLKKCKKTADLILRRNLESWDNRQLLKESTRLKNKVISGISLDDIIVEAYSLVCEASKRTLGLNPYPVQIIAAVALQEGYLIEQYTGEGKTLSAVMPAYLNALTGKGVHILTFNDYLARRDAEWMSPIYQFLGLTVSFVQAGMSLSDKKKAYASDITYVTAKEAGFDYLRDCIALDKFETVHRPFNYVIVDEADSILLDEARVPLVIASNSHTLKKDKHSLSNIVRQLRADEHFEFDESRRNVYLNEAGVAKAEQLLNCSNLYDDKHYHLLSQLNCALHAEILLIKDVDYIVREGSIELIDKYTGRVAINRFLPNGLQAALADKEDIEFIDGGQILGTITLQHFISLYPKICGMTATAKTSQMEFKEIYDLHVLSVPQNRQNIRVDYPHKIYTHKEAKFNALIKDISFIHATGRPILIGTSSVEESELLANELEKMGVNCNVLNAKNDEEEAQIIAKAGMLGAVTVSTNMAGRGVDIKLGNNLSDQIDVIKQMGGLYVIGTHIHENIRIDNQLRGRSGRQGDPGTSIFYISLEDELLTKYDVNSMLPASLKGIKQEEAINHPMLYRKIDHIQRVISGQNFHIQQELNHYSDMVEDQRRILHKDRLHILNETEQPNSIKNRLKLFLIDKYWAEHLSYVSYIREGIHLEALASKNPIDEFHIQISQSFDQIYDRINLEYEEMLIKLDGSNDQSKWEALGLIHPKSTRTYIINDHYNENTRSNWQATTILAFWISLLLKPLLRRLNI